MLTTTQKLPLVPALRPIRRPPARTAASGTKGLHWYCCPAQGAFHHLVLLDGPVQLAHWVLPAGPLAATVADPLADLWTQVSPHPGASCARRHPGQRARHVLGGGH